MHERVHVHERTSANFNKEMHRLVIFDFVHELSDSISHCKIEAVRVPRMSCHVGARHNETGVERYMQDGRTI